MTTEYTYVQNKELISHQQYETVYTVKRAWNKEQQINEDDRFEWKTVKKTDI